MKRHPRNLAWSLAQVIRSKNSGPFQTTLDVIFDDEALYQQIKNSGPDRLERVAQCYHMSVDRICEFVFDSALGFKITFDRAISSGTVGDRDVYGARQHAPLAMMEIQVQ